MNPVGRSSPYEEQFSRMENIERNRHPLWPEVDTTTIDGAVAALYSARWAIATDAGPAPRRIGLAERTLSTLVDYRHVVALCNGSAAIVVALQALGIGPGSRVLVPGLTWVGCVTAILRVGAEPVLQDCAPESLVADYSGERLLDVDAIIAVPLYAETLDLAHIREKYRGVPIVLDLSHVGPIALNDRADVVVASLQASKILTCGEGGYAATDDVQLASRMRALSTDGRLMGVRDELIPSGEWHGANYAMSELVAGILNDQLARFEAQRSRRERGATALLEALSSHGLRSLYSKECVGQGLYYGLPVEVNDPVTEIVDRVWDETGLRLAKCYPPIIEDPLFKPNSVERFREIAISHDGLENGNYWCQRLVIIPHHVALGSPSYIDRLAACLARRPLKIQSKFAHNLPEVTVVIVSGGKRGSLAVALQSVRDQRFEGRVSILLVFDGHPTTHVNKLVKDEDIRKVVIELDSKESIVERVANLRDMALRLVDSEYVCFLDDDNRWEPNHLESLCEKLTQSNIQAAHCWRRMEDENGRPWHGEYFPWLGRDSERERRIYRSCISLGLLERGSDVVKDSAAAVAEGLDCSMVDLGAWMFRTEFIKHFGIHRRYDSSYDVDNVGLGEDDVLLSRIKNASVPIACTKAATLKYRLGGFSNDTTLADRAWGNRK